jgi:hypothetical protein
VGLLCTNWPTWWNVKEDDKKRMIKSGR